VRKLVFTIGYSQLSATKFIQLLDVHGVNAVCDVRSNPSSRSNPAFSQSRLKGWLKTHDISYVPLCRELGARPTDRSVYIDGCVSYRLLAATDYFERGIERVAAGAERFNIALMCAERDPITCHRTILVAPALAKRGIEIEHIWDDGRVEDHEDAIKRLVRTLGYGEQSSEHPKLVEDAAFEAQGRKLAYCDPDMRSEVQSDFLARRV
jgi:uncharacterized protein (DUF488 family)